jgi:GTPase SAR1 family protein
MKSGHVDSLINKVVIYGGSGTGKSSFIDLMVGNLPAEFRESTPLAARPVSVFQIDTNNDQWKKLSPHERKAVLVQAIMSLNSGQSAAEEEQSHDGNISGDEQNPMDCIIRKSPERGHSPPPLQDTEPGTTAPQDPPSPSSPDDSSQDDPKRTKFLRSMSSFDDMVKLVDRCSKTGEAITTYRKILFIDSGGQPQFHEMLPAFLRHMNLYVFVLKLSEELSAKPSVVYYKGGEIVGTPYESAQSNEQLLRHCLRTLHTHRVSPDSNESPSIMIVGTHRDKEGECTAETRADKNQKLASLLLPAFKDEVVYSDLQNDEFIFALNTKSPDAQDRAIAKTIQYQVVTVCVPPIVKVPVRYYCLEIILEEAREKWRTGVLSIDQCLEAANGLHFDKHSLVKALQFLDKMSVIFYFPEVLEGVVFIDPQVLLDKATEPVEKIYSLRTGNGAVGGGEWQEFRDHARFSLKFLEDAAFQKHYVPDLFTQYELIKLFKRLLIVADFSDEQYFMPALLQVLEEEEVCKHRVPSDSDVAALALDFPVGGPRRGIFCTLVSFLVSQNNQHPRPWKITLLPNSNTPACLYRNCIQFSIPRCPGMLQLIDAFTHFEVHVSAANLCTFARRAVFAGFKMATHTLSYKVCTMKQAILCPCQMESTHVAIMGDGNSWICKKDETKYGKLTARYLVWKEKRKSCIG